MSCGLEGEGEAGTGGQAQRLVHLMPQCRLPQLPFVVRKCWAEEKGRHKEQTGLSAGHYLCHRLSQAARQSRQLPGHLVRPLPVALTWHRVDRGPPAGTGTPLQWRFSRLEIHTCTHTMWNRGALKNKEEIRCYKNTPVLQGVQGLAFTSRVMDICFGC